MNSYRSYMRITRKRYAKLALKYACFGVRARACRTSDINPQRSGEGEGQALGETSRQLLAPGVSEAGVCLRDSMKDHGRSSSAHGGVYQAMDTAINASKNIKTPPTRGNTKGIIGTMASTASTSWAVVWVAWVDMLVLSIATDMGRDSNDKPTIALGVRPVGRQTPLGEAPPAPPRHGRGRVFAPPTQSRRFVPTAW